MFESIPQVIMPLAGILRELEFGENLDGEEFENYLLKNKIYQIWKDNDPGVFAKMNKSKNDISLHIFFNILNELLNTQINTKEQAQIVSDRINVFFVKVFRFYIQKETEKKDYKELIKELEDLQFNGLMQKAIVLQIKDLINSKTFKEVKQNKIMEEINDDKLEKIDYAIITALEDDEMEKILEVATINKKIKNKTYLLRIGYFNSNPNKKILFVTQNYTGLVDSSILSTEIISKYKPKLMIMAGVLGGHPQKTKIGDVIVATKVFTIDKGKIEKDSSLKEIESSNINNHYINEIKSKRINLTDYIRDKHPEKKVVNIHFEPIACVRQVIDKVGFFSENISSLDRKTLGVEMESYGVVRATELANEGKTDVLIIKSVMDNTVDKNDNDKKFAGFTSATVIEYLFKENLV